MRDLDSTDWQETSVPSSIFDSLISAGKIKQTDIDTHPEKFSSVSEKPWVYRKIFDAPAELLNCDRVDLVFDGLDTIANIWLNDKLIGRTNNMFIPFRFDATTLLKPQNNVLMVKFEPAVAYAKRLMDRYTPFSEADFRNPHRAYIRKAQYQFGWDFCPSLPGCGIWRPVRLEGTKKARLADLYIKTVDCNHHYADVKIDIKLDLVQKEEFLCQLTLACNGKTIKQDLTFNPGEDFHSAIIHIESPSLWWPAGYGRQDLYQLDVKLLGDDHVIDETQKKFGIRTVKLNRSTGKHKRKFQFVINEQPVFAKGANWVPASIFAGSITDDDYEKLLQQAQKSNMNMLRVWGGGYYESDHFYELCDKLGIMVWQDFMFACAYYPDRQWFLEDVKKEATEVIKRLRNHPCLTLWCGNNEIDWMHNTGKLGSGKKFHGEQIYHKLLPQLVTKLNPDIDYIPTTPLDEKNKSKTSKPLTTHQWDVWSGNQPVRNYLCPAKNVPAFVTEFGLQSLPPMKTIENFCPPEHMRIGSPALEKHNYQLDGNSRLYRYIGDLFATTENLDQFAYLSQTTQARAVKTYVEHLRAHNSTNSGVLFWQFNDCCPAISWSAIDYNKQPKALYYYAKRFFARQLVTVTPELKTRADMPAVLKSLNVIAINDSNQPLNATINCRLIDLFGQPLDKIVFPIAIGAFSASPLLKLPKAFTLPENPDKSCLHLVMEKGGEKIAENLFCYLPDKYIDWPIIKITKQLKQINEKQWKLKLKSNAIVKDVQILTTIPAQFSENFIDLIPPYESEITIDCREQVASLESALRLRWFK
ncbi:MAG: glycoside hydrolase family 2 protein [Planctomycetes bacterium]|nr:glycoside hydrolase family 2 protein [Planctomycetota bacterium]